MAGIQSGLLRFVLIASLINRTLMSPVATQRIAAFDEIARVNEHYGKAFLFSSCRDKYSLSFMLNAVKVNEYFSVTYSSTLYDKKPLIFLLSSEITPVCASLV